MYAQIRRRTYEILDRGADDDVPSKIVDLFIMALIILNVLAVMLETVPSIREAHGHSLHLFDLFSVGIFSIEYLLRIWSCTSNPRYGHPLWGRLRFMIHPMSLIDLAAILPFYLPQLITMDTRAVRALRLFRLFRILKLGRYSTAANLLGRVVLDKKEELTVGFMLMVMLLVVTSSAMYFIEHEAQPEVFSSIPASLWWSVVTLTTVGYGDVTPVTTLGKVVAAVIALLGVGMFALPAGILASGFAREIDRRHTHCGQPRCPHCGGPIGRRSTDKKEYQYSARAS